MSKRFVGIGLLVMWVACCMTACKDDSSSAGSAILSPEDAIVVMADTFPLSSLVENSGSIISQSDSCLLGELETDYGLLRASILSQLACPEGYSYPAGATIDSICLFLYYSSWVGDANSPLAINVYMMDKKTFTYYGTYPSDLKVEDYCSRDKSILTNRRIVVASEKLDSVQDADGNYVPMLRMRVNDDFMDYFWSIQSFESQEAFNQQFKGLLVESSFGSSTMLNVSDLALGVYYHFQYNKAGRDTIVQDMKPFYANSEVRNVNHLQYIDKEALVEELKKDSDTYNYIIAPAGVHTRITFPMGRIADSIMAHMTDDGRVTKRPYVNKAQVNIPVENVFQGSSSDVTRDTWLQPAKYMLLIKEESINRFFAKRELPTDTCALLSSLIQGTDSAGNSIYYYSYDMSDFLTNQLRQENLPDHLNMLLIPVTVNAGVSGVTTSSYSSVRQQETMSATVIKSAKNGMQFEIVYCGFSIPKTAQE